MPWGASPNRATALMSPLCGNSIEGAQSGLDKVPKPVGDGLTELGFRRTQVPPAPFDAAKASDKVRELMIRVRGVK